MPDDDASWAAISPWRPSRRWSPSGAIPSRCQVKPQCPEGIRYGVVGATERITFPATPIIHPTSWQVRHRKGLLLRTTLATSLSGGALAMKPAHKCTYLLAQSAARKGSPWPKARDLVLASRVAAKPIRSTAFLWRDRTGSWHGANIPQTPYTTAKSQRTNFTPELHKKPQSPWRTSAATVWSRVHNLASTRFGPRTTHHRPPSPSACR